MIFFCESRKNGSKSKMLAKTTAPLLVCKKPTETASLWPNAEEKVIGSFLEALHFFSLSSPFFSVPHHFYHFQSQFQLQPKKHYQWKQKCTTEVKRRKKCKKMCIVLSSSVQLCYLLDDIYQESHGKYIYEGWELNGAKRKKKMYYSTTLNFCCGLWRSTEKEIVERVTLYIIVTAVAVAPKKLI